MGYCFNAGWITFAYAPDRLHTLSLHMPFYLHPKARAYFRHMPHCLHLNYIRYLPLSERLTPTLTPLQPHTITHSHPHNLLSHFSALPYRYTSDLLATSNRPTTFFASTSNTASEYPKSLMMMEETRDLLIRNAELQTELRLVKEQLSQANSANAYLLQRLSATETERQSREQELALRENAQLRTVLNLKSQDSNPKLKSTRPKAIARDGEKKNIKIGRKAVLYKHFEASDTETEEGDLLSFEDAENDTDRASESDATPIHLIDDHPGQDDIPLECFTNPPHQVAAHPVPFQGPGVPAHLHSHVSTEPRRHWGFDSTCQTQQPRAPLNSDQGRSGFGFNFINQDGTVIRTGPVNSTEPAYHRAPEPWAFPRRPFPFSSAEHLRLGGLAWLIEDYDQRKKNDTWFDLSRSFGGRPAREYEEYYERVIRPEYLAKERKKWEATQNERAENKQTENLDNSFASTTAVATVTASSENDLMLQDGSTPAQSGNAAQGPGEDAATPSNAAASSHVKEAEIADEALAIPPQSPKAGEGDHPDVLMMSTNMPGRAQQSELLPSAEEMDTPRQHSPDQSGAPGSQNGPGLHTRSLNGMAADPAAAWRSFAHQNKSAIEQIPDQLDKAAPGRGMEGREYQKQPQLALPMHADPNLSVEESENPVSQTTAFHHAPHVDAQAPHKQYGPHINFEKLRRIPEHRDLRGPFPVRSLPPHRGDFRFRPDGRSSRRDGPSFHERSLSPFAPFHVSELFARSDDPRTHRSVLITNIPPNTTLSQVLDRVKGGKIVSATYMETAGMRTKPYMETNSALIVFFAGRDAAKFVQHSKENKFIFFWSEKWEAPFKATAKMLDSPSRPIPQALLKGILQDGMTRMVFVHGGPPGLTPRLVMEHVVEGNDSIKQPLNMGVDQDGVMFLEFASIAEAKAVWQAISKTFTGLSRGFLRDPCERPLDTVQNAQSASLGEGQSDATEDADEAGYEVPDSGVEIKEEHAQAFDDGNITKQPQRQADGCIASLEAEATE